MEMEAKEILEAKPLWGHLPSPALCCIFAHMDCMSRIVAASVSDTWQYCCLTRQVWSSVTYDCVYMKHLQRNNPELNWYVFRRKLFKTITEFSMTVRTARIYGIHNSLDTEALRHIVKNCEHLQKLCVTADEGDMPPLCLRELQDHLRLACSTNRHLRSLSITNVNLTREQWAERRQLYNIFTAHQSENLLALTLISPPREVRGRHSPPHIPCLQMEGLKTLRNLQGLHIAERELDESTLHVLSKNSLREITVDCNRSDIDSFCMLQDYPWMWDLGKSVKIMLQ